MDERILHARLRAAHLFPYFSAGLFALIPIETSDSSKMNGQETMGVDKRWRMLYHTKIFEKWTINEIAAVMVHEVLHLLRDHADRSQVANMTEHIIWNYAADCEINDDLKDAGLPDGVIYPDFFKFKDGLMAEEYFRMLQKETKIDHIPQAGGGACGGCATGEGDEETTEGENGEQVKGITQKEGQVIKDAVAKDIVSAKSRGNVPSGIVRWAEEQLKSRVPWRTILTSCVRGMIGDAAGMVNYSYSRPSRRQSVFGRIIMPCLRAPLPNVAMLIDTSGSMSDRDLGVAVAETDGVLRGLGVDVTVISNDAEVGAIKKVRKKGDIQLVGGGGTNLGPGIEAAMSLKPKINFLIIISDCDAAWGDSIPKFKTIVVKVGRSSSTPPDWIGKTIQVGDED